MVRIIVLVFVSSFVFGCTWSNTVWVAGEPDKKTFLDTEIAKKKGIELLDKPGADKKPFALIEARGTKDAATPVLLLEEAILQAKKIGASSIYCPSKTADAQDSHLMAIDPSQAKAAVELATQFVGIIKDIIALPFTLIFDVKKSFTSDQTLGCSVYKEK